MIPFPLVCVWEHFWNTWCHNTHRKSPFSSNGGNIKYVLSCHVKTYDIHTKRGIYFLCECISAFCCYWWMRKDKWTTEGGNDGREGSWLLISHPANPDKSLKPCTKASTMAGGNGVICHPKPWRLRRMKYMGWTQSLNSDLGLNPALALRAWVN